MNLGSFKEHYGQLLDATEEFSEELYSTVTELMSPAYCHDTLPSFVKRLKYKLNLLKSSPRHLQRSLQESKQQAQESYRVKQFADAMTRLRSKLATLHSQILGLHAGDAAHSDHDKENVLVAFPPTEALVEAKQRHHGNQIISTRMDSALSTCATIQNNCREAWTRENLLRQSTEGVQQVLVETLLNTFDREVYNVSVALRTFYERKVNVQIAQFEAFCRHQRSCALDQQHRFYRDMYRRVKEQHTIFNEMMALLSQQAAHLPHKERLRLEAKVRELQKRQHAIFLDAEIYYEQSQDAFVFQPLSSLFFRSIKRWLVQYQSILAEQLLQLQKTHGAKPPGQTPPPAPSSAALEQNSLLFQFAQRQHPQQYALSNVLDKHSEALCEPRADLVGSLLHSFMSFHYNSNRQNLQRLQAEIGKLQQAWHTLDQRVAQAYRLQQRYYSLHNGELPDVRRATTTATATATGGAPSTSTSPEVIKMLLQLDGQIKALDAQWTWHRDQLKRHAEPEFLRVQEQTTQIAHILQYLKQWQRLSAEWNQCIQHECGMVQNWKDISRANHRYVAMLFIDFNFFVTAQLDNLQSSCQLFASNVFHRMRELQHSFLSQLVEMHSARQTSMEPEMKLLSKLHEDLRREDFVVADVLVRMQTQVHAWYEQNKQRQMAQHQRALKQCLIYHVAGLEALLRKLQEPVANPLIEFLTVLDTMYENAVKCEETSDDQASLLAKEQFLIDKLQQNGAAADS